MIHHCNHPPWNTVLSAVSNLSFFQFTCLVKSQLWISFTICLPWAWLGQLNVFLQKITVQSISFTSNLLFPTSNWCYCSYWSLSFSLKLINLFISPHIFLISSCLFTLNFPWKIRRYYIKTSSSSHHQTPLSPPPNPATLVTISFLLVTMEEVSKASPSSCALDPIFCRLSEDTSPYIFPFLSFASSISVLNGSFSLACRHVPVSPHLNHIFPIC